MNTAGTCDPPRGRIKGILRSLVLQASVSSAVISPLMYTTSGIQSGSAKNIRITSFQYAIGATGRHMGYKT